jgi:hypothetical protein
MIARLVAISLLVSCAKDTAAPPAAPAEVTAADKARGAAIIGELKKSLVGALTSALGQGAPSAVAACHTMAPGLASALSRDGVTVGRATRKPRNPKNEASGWQADALAELERMQTDKVPLAGKSFARRLPDGRIAYAEPLIIQELCLTCHGANVAPEVQAVLAEKYPADKATGYSVGDLRGVAWVELPAPK